MFKILINKLFPKFHIIVNGKKEKYNSVMALKSRMRQLDHLGIEYKWVENW